jgi:hypothetical protein
MQVDQATVAAYNSFIALAKIDLPVWDAELDEARHQIVVHGGCALAFGSFPMSEFPKLLDLVPAEAVMDTNVARMAGANFATGLASELARLAAKLQQEALRRTKSLYEGAGLSEEAICWLAIGEQGNSSSALFFHLSNVQQREPNQSSSTSYPHDANDFRRCRLMLEQVPELIAPFLTSPCQLSPTWNDIWSHWTTLCATMDCEHPEWRTREGRAPQTTAMLRQVVAG